MTGRPRLTPNASRSATSRRRRTERASSRLATLAQATSSTMTATPLTQLATLVTVLCVGPRSACTGPATATGWAISAGVWFGLRLVS